MGFKLESLVCMIAGILGSSDAYELFTMVTLVLAFGYRVRVVKIRRRVTFSPSCGVHNVIGNLGYVQNTMFFFNLMKLRFSLLFSELMAIGVNAP